MRCSYPGLNKLLRSFIYFFLLVVVGLLYTAERVYLLSQEEVIVRRSRRLPKLCKVRSSLEETVERLKSRERIRRIAENNFRLSDARIDQIVYREREVTPPKGKPSLLARIKLSFKKIAGFVFERRKLREIWEI